MLPSYSMWFDMKQRCTSERSQRIRPTYVGVTLEEGWLDYDVFCEWCHQQPFYAATSIDGKPYVLDKDFLSGKHYGPETCVFIPEALNKFYRGLNTFKGFSLLPSGKYRADIYDVDKRCNVLLGCFQTQEEARLAYRVAKRLQALKLADRYRGQVDPRVIKVLEDYQ